MEPRFRFSMRLFLPYAQEFKGYVFKIKGGCDKQGFPMKQGVLIPGRASILMHRGKLIAENFEGSMHVDIQGRCGLLWPYNKT
jgi:hypothetical protein